VVKICAEAEGLSDAIRNMPSMYLQSADLKACRMLGESQVDGAFCELPD
jgi:hypothetical protein